MFGQVLCLMHDFRAKLIHVLAVQDGQTPNRKNLSELQCQSARYKSLGVNAAEQLVMSCLQNVSGLRPTLILPSTISNQSSDSSRREIGCCTWSVALAHSASRIVRASRRSVVPGLRHISRTFRPGC